MTRLYIILKKKKKQRRVVKGYGAKKTRKKEINFVQKRKAEKKKFRTQTVIVVRLL